ncbi:DUF4173 domain-containing protein [Streptomyces sp. WAC07149]|uniref:DUF4153 domain-containing protein n=1 Tax=Streptomyces sp. WAC07149 TaxID=2487425 RepID=UPI000F77F162|nr:DUF4173 domain-containing protein [Streptomyces sp. WAC07149]RST01676.1 DUF4173 domain-containing protein [Streptomyces sp. WAC07149]
MSDNVGDAEEAKAGGPAQAPQTEQTQTPAPAGPAPGPGPAGQAPAPAGQAPGPAAPAPAAAGPTPVPPPPGAPGAPAPPAPAVAPIAPGFAGHDPAAWHLWQMGQLRLRQQQAREEAAARAANSMWRRIRPAEAAPIHTATLVAVLAAGLTTAVVLGDGMGPGLLLAVLPAMVAAYAAARAAGRKARPWSLLWAAGCVALLAVPALRDSAWPSTLAILAAVLLAALALHGTRSWPGVLLAPLGFLDSAVSGVGWAWAGLRSRGGGAGRDRWVSVVKAALVAAVLLIVFGALFASADAAFADLLGGLLPDVSVGEGPFRFLLFLLGAVLALAAARTAAAPHRWDRVKSRQWKARSRVEWSLPLIVLNLLFAGFNAVQLAVLFGGYDKVLESTGLTYAEYARQGFWQLLWATVFVLAVIALALRWAPRGGAGDRRLVRSVLGTLCVLTLVVVASAVRRMDLYVDAYGLTRLRLSVVTMELWLGLVIVLLMAAGIAGGRWLARAVVGSAAATVLAFGLASPDGIIAEYNVTRYQQDNKLDLAYLRDLSSDAAPYLDRLPEPRRSCALMAIEADLRRASAAPWYATSLGEHRARRILRERPVTATVAECSRLGAYASRVE